MPSLRCNFHYAPVDGLFCLDHGRGTGPFDVAVLPLGSTISQVRQVLMVRAPGLFRVFRIGTDNVSAGYYHPPTLNNSVWSRLYIGVLGASMSVSSAKQPRTSRRMASFDGADLKSMIEPGVFRNGTTILETLELLETVYPELELLQRHHGQTERLGEV